MSLDRYLIEKFGTYFFCVYLYLPKHKKKPNKINIYIKRGIYPIIKVQYKLPIKKG